MQFKQPKGGNKSEVQKSCQIIICILLDTTLSRSLVLSSTITRIKSSFCVRSLRHFFTTDEDKALRDSMISGLFSNTISVVNKSYSTCSKPCSTQPPCHKSQYTPIQNRREYFLQTCKGKREVLTGFKNIMTDG